MQIQDIAENDNPWVVFVETTDPANPQAKLPYFEKDSKYVFVDFDNIYQNHLQLLLHQFTLN